MTWSSSNPAVVTVDASGIIRPQANGYAMILAQTPTTLYEFPILVSIVEWNQLGDVDLDGDISSSDAVLVLNSYLASIMDNPT
ncbi:MAG TPA: hypothetical protein DCG49_08865, partial [Ruminococcus sp.]|nr:hypothetical protein [Ruminococcus sp.]